MAGRDDREQKTSDMALPSSSRFDTYPAAGHSPRGKPVYNSLRMNFLKLLDGAEVIAQQGDPPIAGIDYDSRRVKPGWCFVAIKGEIDRWQPLYREGAGGWSSRRRERFIAAARGRFVGAGVTWAQGVSAPERELLSSPGREAQNHRHHRHQWQDHHVVHSSPHVAERQSARRMLVGTVEYRIGDEMLPSPHTTPESLELNQLFSRALKPDAPKR